MAADNFVRSYGDNSRKEDVVLNAVEILTARENFIMNRLAKTEAIDTVHSYLVDSLKTPASNAQKEGDDYSYLARSTPSRLTNIVQHIQIPFAVTDTQRNIEHYHGRDELDRQTEKALMEFGNDVEFNIVRSTLTSGVSGTAPAMSLQKNSLTSTLKTAIMYVYEHYMQTMRQIFQSQTLAFSAR